MNVQGAYHVAAHSVQPLASLQSKTRSTTTVLFSSAFRLSKTNFTPKTQPIDKYTTLPNIPCAGDSRFLVSLGKVLPYSMKVILGSQDSCQDRMMDTCITMYPLLIDQKATFAKRTNEFYTHTRALSGKKRIKETT